MRVADWEARLRTVLFRHSALPFQYGTSDCFKFPMDVVEALTGADPLALINYKNEIAAARCLRKLVCITVGDLFAKAFVEIEPAFARRGDIGVICQSGEISGAVVLGAELLCKSEQGLRRWPRSKLLRAFQVE